MKLVRVVAVLVALVAGSIAAYYRTRSTEHIEKFADEVIAVINTKVEACDTNEKAHKFLAEQMPQAQDDAWNEAYTAPNRRQPAKFDKKKYCDSFFKHLINAARLSGQRDLDQPLRRAQIEAEMAIVEMTPS